METVKLYWDKFVAWIGGTPAKTIAIIIAVLLGLWACSAFALSPPGTTLKAGEEINVSIFCIDEQTVVLHGRSVLDTSGFAGANALLQADKAAGKCMVAPYPVQVEVVSSRVLGHFKDADGDNSMEVVSVRLGDGSPVWTLVIRVLGAGA
jgi:hypothetical protein